MATQGERKGEKGDVGGLQDQLSGYESEECFGNQKGRRVLEREQDKSEGEKDQGWEER